MFSGRKVASNQLKNPASLPAPQLRPDSQGSPTTVSRTVRQTLAELPQASSDSAPEPFPRRLCCLRNRQATLRLLRSFLKPLNLLPSAFLRVAWPAPFNVLHQRIKGAGTSEAPPLTPPPSSTPTRGNIPVTPPPGTWCCWPSGSFSPASQLPTLVSGNDTRYFLQNPKAFHKHVKDYWVHFPAKVKDLLP